MTSRPTADSSAESIVARIESLYRDKGHSPYEGGESVSQMAHGLQAAACGTRAGAAPGLVAAALLHDIGHLLDPVGEGAAVAGYDARHEDGGADHLTQWFGPEVTEPIRLHVAAKRYLCATKPGYFERLSPASVRSLALQGGPMSAEEVAAFEARPHFRDAVRLRVWDEEAKVIDLAVPAFETYRDMLSGLVHADGA
ncbi:MAG: metal-dependent phosphohydrolase [Zavarzinia sp.]|nr:metal-dependent phosphohydrolase [Zavarzinia sp.]